MPKLISPPQSCFARVRFSRAEVEAFNDTWPCSELGNRALWFEYDRSNGDLVDHNLKDHEDGSAALALSHDGQVWLEKHTIELKDGALYGVKYYKTEPTL